MSKEAINKTTRTLVDSLKKAMTMDNETGKVTPEWYASTLPKGIDIELVNKLQEHNSSVVAALPVALAEVGLSTMKEKNLPEISAFINAGSDRIGATIIRDYTHGKDKYHGHTVMSYEVNAAGVNAGEYEHATKHVRSLADDLFTK